ncbi:hypothetical protein NC651_021004 [Populus alba x Populus x berolinensis]|nr:hypothetical protein NC651_021004 [Populus alba x Populus x berolinensis]
MELLVQCLRHQILGMSSILYPGSSVFSSRCSFLDRVTSPCRCLHGNGTEAHEWIWSSERDIQS